MTLLLIAIAVSLIFWIGAFYKNLTKEIPKSGGEYNEGIVGQPLYVNPAISQTSEADSTLAQLIFSGLFKYDNDSKIAKDLAEDYSISDDKKEYKINLKKNVTWHDGEPLNAQDVFFTFNILQDPAYKSPLRQSLQGVEARVDDDYTIVFILKNQYSGFLENLTFGILPKHIWQDIAPEKFSLAEYNLHPIGSGPYMFSDMQKDADGTILTFKLVAFKNFYDGAPYISRINFNFYPDDSALMDGYNKKEVMSMASIPPQNIKDIKNSKSTKINRLAIPRYFAVFFNQTKSVVLADDNVRKALNLGVDREQIIKEILFGEGVALNSPFLPQMEGYDDDDIKTDTDKAQKILDDNGWSLDKDENVRKKNGTKLEFELVTTDWPEFVQTADMLKVQWEKLGARVNVKVMSVSDLQQNYIRSREYDSLLFGQGISFNPDLYSFWHSSFKNDPGLNLSSLDDKDADGLLESIRQEFDESKRKESYEKLQEIFSKEVPATFLYARYYIYPTNTKLKGMEVKNINNSQQRFTDVSKWYVKTKRVLK
ncbi:MAG TPA: peptide ABC transporter substrate-binding protein [Candidatus Moranbacteria bacterium]|nr:peptide ABC transporter substrate-binding protein [Candidatus Moranbacteria bacterium]HRZ34099.1 peptide ABC transporter substrate-binding protein [Candidatus Moranbacteria bacterium]